MGSMLCRQELALAVQLDELVADGGGGQNTDVGNDERDECRRGVIHLGAYTPQPLGQSVQRLCAIRWQFCKDVRCEGISRSNRMILRTMNERNIHTGQKKSMEGPVYG